MYYLKDQVPMKMTANTFGIARCTIESVVHEIYQILSENIGPKIVKFPVSKQEVAEATGHFLQKFGFPQVIGCIDGTHIPIKQPSENSHDYFSYRMCYTINCQAICDAYGKFINVEVKWSDSVHDARVFANCDIQNNYSSGKFNLFYKEILPGYDCIPQLLLADLAYPLLPYVMKEYEHCSTNEEVVFNQMLRSTRNTIECAFENFKARWRILQRPMDIPVDKLPNVMYACFVLHNFCDARKSEIDPVELEVVMQEERRT